MLEINYTNRNNIHKTYKIGLDWIGYNTVYNIRKTYTVHRKI